MKIRDLKNLDVLRAKIAHNASGANEIVPAVTGKKIVVLHYNLSAASAVNAKWQSAATDISGLKYMAGTGGMVADYSPCGLVETAAGEALNLNLSSGVAVGGELSYVTL